MTVIVEVLSFQFPTKVPFGISFLDALTLVELLFAASDSKPDLDFSPFIVHRNRHYCQSFLSLCRLQIVKFFFGEQELAVATLVVAFCDIFWLVGGNVDVHDEGLLTPHNDIGPFQRTLFLAERLYLMAKKLDACLEFFQKFVIEFCFSILE